MHLVPSHLLRTKQTALRLPGKFQLFPLCPRSINPRSPIMTFPFRRITLPSPPSRLEGYCSIQSLRPANPGRMRCRPRSQAAPSISSGKPKRNLVIEKSLPSLLIKLISAGQEAGRRGNADTCLAKLLAEMALISHPGGKRQEAI